MGIRIKYEGNGRWTLRNEGAFDGNRTFFLLGHLRETGFTGRLATGEGAYGTFSSVTTDQLDELRRKMAAAGVEEILPAGMNRKTLMAGIAA